MKSELTFTGNELFLIRNSLLYVFHETGGWDEDGLEKLAKKVTEELKRLQDAEERRLELKTILIGSKNKNA